MDDCIDWVWKKKNNKNVFELLIYWVFRFININ